MLLTEKMRSRFYIIQAEICRLCRGKPFSCGFGDPEREIISLAVNLGYHKAQVCQKLAMRVKICYNKSVT